MVTFDMCLDHEHYITVCLYGMCFGKIHQFLHFTRVVFLPESITTSAAVAKALFSISKIYRRIHDHDVSPLCAEGGVLLPPPVSVLCGFNL